MMLESGQVIKGQKDDKGQPLSDIAAKHMADYRISCYECKKVFCAQCNSQPYHIGKTC